MLVPGQQTEIGKCVQENVGGGHLQRPERQHQVLACRLRSFNHKTFTAQEEELWISILILFDADPDPTFHPDADPDPVPRF